MPVWVVDAVAERPRAVLSWAGVALIAASIFLMTDAAHFPRALASIPVLDTLLVIAAGSTGAKWSRLFVGGTRPVQFVGEISYSLYLWHWPLIILAPIVIGHPIGMKTVVAVAVLSVVLAIASKFVVEDPIHRRSVLRRRTTYLTAALSMSVVVGLAGCTVIDDASKTALAVGQQQAVLATGPCAGAAAFEGPDCSDPFTPTRPLNVMGGTRDGKWVGADCDSGTLVVGIVDSFERTYGSGPTASRSSAIRTPRIGCGRSGIWPISSTGDSTRYFADRARSARAP